MFVEVILHDGVNNLFIRKSDTRLVPFFRAYTRLLRKSTAKEAEPETSYVASSGDGPLAIAGGCFEIIVAIPSTEE